MPTNIWFPSFPRRSCQSPHPRARFERVTDSNQISSLRPLDPRLAHAVLYLCLWALLPSGFPTHAAAPDNSPNFTFTDPSPDAILCRGEGVEVKRRELDRALSQFKANALARNQNVPENRLPDIEAMLLDRLVVTELLLQRATSADRDKGKELATKFLDETREQAGSDAAFQRQLMAMSFSEAELQSQILERAICEEVVEREVRSQAKISDEQVRQYFDENADRLKRPEMVRASHVLLATINPLTNEPLPAQEIANKRQLIGKIRERALAGEDFAELIKTYSEDPGARENNGIYTFARGQMVPEFEAAAFSMATDQISDIVTTRFGYHLIKLLQKIPAEPIEFDKVESDIRASLERQEVQDNLLPPFLDQLRAAAKLQYLNGAKPPPAGLE
jgi:peptidyl-prolyl cis-trans isomerase C